MAPGQRGLDRGGVWGGRAGRGRRGRGWASSARPDVAELVEQGGGDGLGGGAGLALSLREDVPSVAEAFLESVKDGEISRSPDPVTMISGDLTWYNVPTSSTLPRTRPSNSS